MSIARVKAEKPKLTIERIIEWAKHHYGVTGVWPSTESGQILAAKNEKWVNVNSALRNGSRGLAGGTTLARILRPLQGTGYRLRSPLLTKEKILSWADTHRRRTGKWPTHQSGPVRDAPGETWDGIRIALERGRRGLAPSGSLARFLAKHRGAKYDIRHVRGRKLSLKQIKAWASAHYQRHGQWPHCHLGAVEGVPGETWGAINLALAHGYRGLPKRPSLAVVLGRTPGSRRRLTKRPLTHGQILRWADQHHRRTGRWPLATSGPVLDAPSENWGAIHSALVHGLRGLKKNGGNLARLLARAGRAPLRPRRLTPLSRQQILEWADEHFKRTGKWPAARSGKIHGLTTETWKSIDSALKKGGRGLSRGSSLSKLMTAHSGRRPHRDIQRLTLPEILRWADAYHRRTQHWPNIKSGTIPESRVPGETWATVGQAFFRGSRGLPSSLTLSRFLERERRVMPGSFKSTLTKRLILHWAEQHYRRHGWWPSKISGPVEDAPGENWNNINSALVEKRRGLTDGISLSRLLAEKKARSPALRQGGPLAVNQILLWAKAHARRTGQWPEKYDGRIPDARGETWFEVDRALREGLRGLAGGTSLFALLKGRPVPRPIRLVRR